MVIQPMSFLNLKEKMEDITNRSLQVIKVFRHPIALVWEAWTTPEQLVNWWGPNGFSSSIHKWTYTKVENGH